MVNSSCGTEPHLDKFKDHQPECEAVQFKESDTEVSINAAVSGPVVISHVAQNNVVSDRLQSTELALESSNLHEIDTALIEVLYEVKQANLTTLETKEHSTDINNGPQDQPDLDVPVIKLLEDLDEVENGTKTIYTPEPPTYHKNQSSPHPYHEHSPDAYRDGMLFQETEIARMDPKARYDYPGRISGTILKHLEETCFNSEIQLQATEETETLEPPAKKRLRRRMGMCGLGDRKRKFSFDGQHCRQGLLGRQREEGDGKGNKGVEHLYNKVLENDGTTPMDRKETTRSACKENEEVLNGKENNGTAVMDDERSTGVGEKENRYALKNMSECTVLMNDKVTTDESPTENRDVLKKGVLEENDDTVLMDDKGTVEQMVLEHELNLLEDISGVGQTLLNPTIGEIFNMIQDEPSVVAATNDHEIENVTCGYKSNFPGTKMTNNGQCSEFNMKHDVPFEIKNLHANNKVDEDPEEIAAAAEVEVTQEMSTSSICATVEMSEGFVMVIKEIQEIPTGLEEGEMKAEEQCPPNIAANEEQCPLNMAANEEQFPANMAANEEKYPPNMAANEEECPPDMAVNEEECPPNIDANDSKGPEVNWSTEQGSDPLFANKTDIAVIASTEIQNTAGHGENDKPITAVSESIVPAAGEDANAKGISEPMAPPTGQENYMHCLLDQNVCDTSVTPSVAEQQFCNPTLTPTTNKLPQETCVGLLVPSLLYSMTDSQLHEIVLSMELEDQPIPEASDHQEDATELVRGLIRELSSLNRTVMAAHREMELSRRGKLPKAPNRRPCSPHHTIPEM